MKTLLANLSSELIKKLYSRGHKRICGDGQVIFARGGKAEFLPIVISGAVKMIREPEIGKEVIIGIFHNGEMFAVPPVFDGGSYPATAVAMEETVLVQIGRADFLQILHESTEFAFQVIAWTCEMLREKTSMIRTLAAASPENRVARVLAKLSDEHPTQPPIKINLRRQDMSEMAGLTTETTIRVIRRFADQQLVRIEHGKIFIDEIEPLRKFLKE